MFCDLVDSTALANTLDPEDWRDLLRAYEQLGNEIITRFGGYTAQYLGDALLAYFGFPTAREDEAERAIRAGLGLVDALRNQGKEFEERYGARLAVRIGVHTGPLVVAAMGTGAARGTFATGDATHIAARLQACADPNCVVMSAANARLVAGIFVTEDLGFRELKGIAQPVRVFRAVHVSGMRSRLDVASARELSPFVGREAELKLLEDRFSQACDGRGHAVLISGEAGIGKSRLVQTLRERLQERRHTWLELHGSPYMQDNAFEPILALQRQGLGFHLEDSAQIKQEALKSGLSTMGFDVEEMLPLLAAFHGVPIRDHDEALELSPEAARKKLIGLFAEWLMRLGGHQPTVMVVEDLHWLDPSSLEACGQAFGRLPGAPVLFIATHRSDFQRPWESSDHVTALPLARLTRSQVRDLIAKAAGPCPVPETWVDQILERADGVPLFAEELLRVVLDSDQLQSAPGSFADVGIPDTLQDLLESRLDALGPVKELAQLGSVLGREFSYDLLLKVSSMVEGKLQSALAEAVRSGLFYQREALPDASYLFRHALLRDAAYHSLLRSARRRHHLHVAETIVEQLPDLGERHPEMVAHHLTEAREYERAVLFWKRSAERLSARSAHREAAAQFRRGLEALLHTPTSPERDELELSFQVGLGVSLQALEGFSSSAVHATYERARELCERVRDPAMLASGLWGSLAFHITTGELARASELAERLRSVRGAESFFTIRAASEYALGNVAFLEGRFADAVAHCETALTHYRVEESAVQTRRWGHDFKAVTHAYLGWSLWPLGRFEAAQHHADDAVAQARSVRDPFTLAFALVFAGAVAKMRREPDRVRSIAEEAIALSEEQSYPLWLGTATILRGWSDAGSLGALEETRRGIAIASSTQNQSAAPHILGILAEVTHAAGLIADALGAVDLALAAAEKLGMHFWDAELYGQRGILCLELGDSWGSGSRAPPIIRGGGTSGCAWAYTPRANAPPAKPTVEKPSSGRPRSAGYAP